MIRSSLITPVRWYDDYNEQNRFSIDCDICDFQLISDKTRLLPFQIKRPRSGYQLSRWFLRSACNEPFKNILNTNDSNFTYNTGFWSSLQYQFINGKMRASASFGTGYIKNLTALTIGKLYEVKIIVSEYRQFIGSSFDVVISNNSVVSQTITSIGTYTAKFTATATDIQVSSTSSNSTNYAIIESIEIREVIVFDTLIGDIDLPLSKLYLRNAGDFDVISYCGDLFDFQLTCGSYYMIVYDGQNNAYYSEIITVKDFIPSQSPYVMLEWYNTCDMKDVLYNPIDCQYKNRLYIDGPISTPTYPITETGDTDGNEQVNITFQKWEKKETLTAPKCPEFITDSLTIIRLHDTIEVTRAIRKKQIRVSDMYEVEKIETDISYIFSDCASNVQLIMTLKDKVIDSTCCVNIADECVECDYEVDEVGVIKNGYYYGNPPGGGAFSIYEVTPGAPGLPDIYTDVKFTGVLVCVGSERFKRFNSTWNHYPFIDSVDISGGLVTVYGYNYDSAYAEIVVEYRCPSYVMVIIPGLYTSEQLLAGVSFDESYLPTGPCEFINIFFRSASLSCSYGLSNQFPIEH